MTILNRLTDFFPPFKSTHYTILLTLLFCLSNISFAQTTAFPDAEGFGRYASGGRGGTLIKVTNLNDSGPGSFRQAAQYASGARTIVFEVGGTIILNSVLSIKNGNVTIAGQTAPGDGILIKGSMVIIEASNVIMRHIRFRPGNSQPNTPDGLNITAWGTDIVEDIIIDHCSISWANDENFDVRSATQGIVRNITLQNSIIAESGYGASAAKNTFNKTYYKNLFIHNRERNIAYGFPTDGTFDSEMINNLIYGFRWASSPSMGSKFTILNNHYRKSSQVPIIGTAVDGTFAGQGTPSETYAYIAGNITPAEMSEYNSNLIPYIKTTPYLSSGIIAINANQVANDILPHVGASLPNRDAVDVRLINQYNNGNGSLVSSGIYPVMQNGSAPADSDNDGMPNVWESQNGLNPNNASDRNTVQPDGYTNLEYFLNGMSIIGNTATGCSNEVLSFPYSESFENSLGDWTQSNTDDINWTVDADGTPSAGTGPSSASNGAYYVFVEASGSEIGFPTKQAVLNSPCFNLSGLSDANFSFKYHQSGSNDMGVIDLEASVDNGANWTSIWTSTGDKVDNWLTANVDLGAYVGASVKLRFNRITGNTWEADIAIDEVSLSGGVNTGSNNCSGAITSFPYTEGFENTLGAWTQSSVDDMDWTIDADGTPSGGTGPSSASENTYYVFVEASGNPTKQALLNSPCFDLSSLSDPNFSFKYHQYGSSDTGIIDLEASDDNGANWTSIWNSEGNLGNTWLTANIDLGAYIGNNVQLRFNRVIGNSYKADIAIDDVSLSEGISSVNTGCSEGITSFPYTEGFENTLGAWTQSSVDDMDWTIDADGTPSNGTGPSYAYQSAYYIFVEASGNPTKQALLNSPCFDLSSLSEANFSFKYHQYGSNDTGTIDLEASDDNGANWTSIWNSSGSIANTWLTANIDLGTYVGNNVQFRFNRVIGNSYKADIAIDDVSLSEGISNGNTSCLGEITNFPYTESFENTLGAWTQSTLDDIDWTVDADGTPSVRTGPSSASQGTHYIFVEASQNLTKQAVLNSPCFDLSAQSSAQFSFDYHQFGSSNMGTINLEASDDNGISWASIWRSTGNLGDSWLTANIDLVAYVGSNVQLRFNRVTGSTWEADIAIDNINLSNGMATRETTVITTEVEVEVEVEVLHIKDITLYPNPVKGGLLNIKSTYTNISFEIYNMVGQLVSKGKVKNKAINVSNLNEGIYQIRFSSEGKTITKRFIKQ